MFLLFIIIIIIIFPFSSSSSFRASHHLFPLLLILLFISSVVLECPRKTAQQRQKLISAEDEDVPEGAASRPGAEPAKQYIQTTFVHRDETDIDREFAHFVRLKLAELRPRLFARAHVTVDNENIECSTGTSAGLEPGSGSDQQTPPPPPIIPSDHRCREYPLREAFHFLVVEDSRRGAAVYSIGRERNWDEGGNRARTMARVEAALLDALSRHSSHPLAAFASDEATNEVGFVREVGSVELEQYMRQNHEILSARPSGSSFSRSGPTIFTRSPTELRLFHPHLLAHRRVPSGAADRESAWFAIGAGAALLHFRGPELAEMLEDDEGGEEGHRRGRGKGRRRTVFVLFWNEASPVSVHALVVWARAGARWKEQHSRDREGDDAVLGAIACHEEDELCRAFGVSPHASTLQLVAFRQGQRVAQQLGIGDDQFMLEWIRMVLRDPLIRLPDPDSVRRAQLHGILPGADTAPVAALTIGHFRSEQQEEFRRFARVATLLHGRYNLAYWLEEGERTDSGARLSTFRRSTNGHDGMDEEQFRGAEFETRALLEHITRASLPDVLDIGRGFTWDTVFPPPRSSLLLLHHSSPSSPSRPLIWLAQLASTLRRVRPRARRLPVLAMDFAQSLHSLASSPQSLLNSLGFGADHLPALCLLAGTKEMSCALGAEAMEALMKSMGAAQLLAAGNDAEGAWKEQFAHMVHWDPARLVHPLALIQRAHIETVFFTEADGQQIPLTAEMFGTEGGEEDAEEERDPHDFARMEPAAIGGCPMMAHLNQHQQPRDEL